MINLIPIVNSPAFAIASIGGIYWLYKRFRKNIRAGDIYAVFIEDMGNNHLRHIYHTLGQIAAKLGIELEEPPPIKFVSPKEYEDREG